MRPRPPVWQSPFGQLRLSGAFTIERNHPAFAPCATEHTTPSMPERSRRTLNRRGREAGRTTPRWRRPWPARRKVQILELPPSPSRDIAASSASRVHASRTSSMWRRGGAKARRRITPRQTAAPAHRCLWKPGCNMAEQMGARANGSSYVVPGISGSWTLITVP